MERNEAKNPLTNASQRKIFDGPDKVESRIRESRRDEPCCRPFCKCKYVNFEFARNKRNDSKMLGLQHTVHEKRAEESRDVKQIDEN